MVWCGILAPKTLQAVVLQEERRPISQHQIRHGVSQLKELSVGCGALQHSYCHLGNAANAEKAVCHVSTSCLVH